MEIINNLEVIPKTSLKTKDVETIKQVNKTNKTIYYVKLTNNGGICPRCGLYVTRIKDYSTLKITHSKDIFISYKRRRFKCDCGYSFYEYNPFSGKEISISFNCIKEILEELKRYNHPYLEVAQRYDLSVTKIIEVFDSYVQIPRHPLREVISIDEFYFSRRSKDKYAFLILGLNGEILDIVKSRKKSTLLDYFQSIPLEERIKVKYVTMDMNKIYKDVINRRIPKAIICIDSFHVVANINKALDDLRIKVMNLYSKDKLSDEYYLLKKCRFFLFTDEYNFNVYRYNKHFKMKMYDYELRDRLFKICPDIELAFFLKEEYRTFNKKIHSLDYIHKFLDSYIEECLSSNIDEFIIIGNLIDNWKVEIANSFIIYKDKRLSNGKIENRNHYIKSLLNIANGYSNFERFRNRVMYSENYYEKIDYELKDKRIKRHFPKRGKYKKSAAS